MTRDEQIKTLEDILVLEANALQLSDDIKRLKHQKFRNPPKAPDRFVEHYPLYPAKKISFKVVWAITIVISILSIGISMYDMQWLCFVGPLVGFGIAMGLYAIDNMNYKADCVLAEEECKKRNDREREAYEKELNTFQEALKRHRQEKAEWEAEHKAEYESAAKEYNDTIDAINSIYDDSKLVPLQYRNVEVVSYLYDYMSSSEADIQQGLVSYDSHVQHELTQSHIREQKITNALTDRSNEIAQHQAELTMEQNMIAARQNELAEESNAIAEKTRRDQNIAAAISILQRHHTNKKLRDIDNFNRYGY